MRNDMIQNSRGGWFYRDRGDGTADSLSEMTDSGVTPIVPISEIPGAATVLVRDRKLTGNGDLPAARLALFLLNKRYPASA